MPILQQKTKEITLPESGAKVLIFENLTYGMILDYQSKSEEEKQVLDNSLDIACLMIVSWDITDENGNKIEINKQSLKLLSYTDGEYLVEQINKTIEEKKTLN